MVDNNFKINPLAAFVKSTSNIIKAKYTLIDNLNKIEVNSKYWFSLCNIAENTLVAKWTRRWFPKPEIGGSNPSRGNQMSIIMLRENQNQIDQYATECRILIKILKITCLCRK